MLGGKTKPIPRYAALLALAIAGQAAAGEVQYDAKANRIVVAGFPEERPATLDNVLAADRAQGWKKIAYDSATDTFTLRATLWIGSNRDWGTFFQIGRPGHPRETLVLHGDLVVSLPRQSGIRYDGRYRVSNRLTLGAPERPDIRPTIKIACSRKNEFRVRVLAPRIPQAPKARENLPMGEWFMFHSTLTAATPDAQHTYAAEIWLSHAGVNYRFENSTISWWAGTLFRTAYIYIRTRPKRAERVARGMTFEHGGNAQGPFDCEDCVFRDLAIGRVDSGATRCRFEGNRENLRMTPGHVGAVFLDCALGPALRPLRLPRSTRSEHWLRNYSVYRRASDLRLVLNPGIVERHSLLVKVVDGRGRPVAGAAVAVECADAHPESAVFRGFAVTDRDGLTPSVAKGRALVITTRERRPTDDPARPRLITHAYRLHVSASGYEPLALALDARAAIPRPLKAVVRPADATPTE